MHAISLLEGAKARGGCTFTPDSEKGGKGTFAKTTLLQNRPFVSSVITTQVLLQQLFGQCRSGAR